MYAFNAGRYHVWRPNLDDVAKLAINQRNRVTLWTHWPLDKCNKADLTLYGRFIAFGNFQAQFLTENYRLDLSKNFPANPECDYTFKARMTDETGAAVVMEYGGRALILDSELGKNDLPLGLLLRVSAPTRAKRVRAHNRVTQTGDIAGMPGLMLVEKIPASRMELLALLALYYKDKTRERPTLVDISAGGVCVKTGDTHYQRIHGSGDKFLFFFFTDEKTGHMTPAVFVCKKVGIFRDPDSQRAGLRLKFIKELVWEQPEDNLKWIDVEAGGSIFLGKILDG